MHALFQTSLNGVHEYVGVHWRRGDRGHPEMGEQGDRMWALSQPEHLSCEINRLLLEYNVSAVFVGTNCGTPADRERLRALVHAPLVFLSDLGLFQDWQHGLDAVTVEMFVLAYAKVFLTAGDSFWGSSTISRLVVHMRRGGKQTEIPPGDWRFLSHCDTSDVKRQWASREMLAQHHGVADMTEAKTEAEDGVEGRGVQEERVGEVWGVEGQGQEGQEEWEGRKKEKTMEHTFVVEPGREGKGARREEKEVTGPSMAGAAARHDAGGGGACTFEVRAFSARAAAEDVAEERFDASFRAREPANCSGHVHASHPLAVGPHNLTVSVVAARGSHGGKASASGGVRGDTNAQQHDFVVGSSPEIPFEIVASGAPLPFPTGAEWEQHAESWRSWMIPFYRQVAEQATRANAAEEAGETSPRDKDHRGMNPPAKEGDGEAVEDCASVRDIPIYISNLPHRRDRFEHSRRLLSETMGFRNVSRLHSI